jgi:ELWxxDGT repeat protein
MVKDLYNGGGSSSPAYLVAVGDLVYFSALTATNGRELARSDGTIGGTYVIADLNPGTASSSPANLIAAGKGVYFSATLANTGNELYFSDGTSPGTSLICDIYPGINSSSPSSLHICDGTLYMRATTLTHGQELYSVGGTPATVETLGEGCAQNYPILRSTPGAIGANMMISGNDAPSTGVRVLIVGLLATPTYIKSLVGPGCWIWEDLTLPTILLPLPAGSSWKLRFPLPNNSSLIGSQAAMQAAYDPMPLMLTNGLKMTLGN